MSSRNTLARLSVSTSRFAASNSANVRRFTLITRMRDEHSATRPMSCSKCARRSVMPSAFHASNNARTPLKSSSHSETGASSNISESSLANGRPRDSPCTLRLSGMTHP
jgi:hypothetical protein